MLDEYIALPPLRCPLCCQSIPSWEGRDGPREGLSWRQGTSRPEGADGQELDESLRALRLPQQFRLRATCGCSGQQRLLDAVGECTQETWTSTRLLPLRPSVDDSRETMEQIIGEEMADIRDEAVLSAVRKGLVHPELHQREWDYSATRVVYPCWWVARFPQINQGLVYSEHGHAYNWGAIELDSNWFGMDACWHGSLEEAFALFIHRRLSGVQWRKDQWA